MNLPVEMEYRDRLQNIGSPVRLIYLCLFVLAATGASAQAPPTTSGAARASVLTVLPGDAIHALFGHTALRIHDPELRIDEVFNYGTFAFDDPWFVPRFVYGQLDYFLSVYDYRYGLAHYRDEEGRPVIEQTLDLTPEEVNAMYRFLRINALPENRTYRYDFFFDNCSTRPRDVIEEVLGDQLLYGGPAESEATFRELIYPYIEAEPFLRTGINLLLGTPADRPATARERMFLPLELFDALEEATVIRDGFEIPLVAATDTVAWVDGYETPTTDAPWAVITTTLLLVVTVVISIVELTMRRVLPTAVDATLLSLVGLVGIVVLFMWLVSQHTVTGPNINLYWAWPTHLVAAYLLQRGRRSLTLRIYLILAAIVTALFAALWLAWPQYLPIAMFPVVVLVAIRCGMQWLRTAPAQSPQP